MTHIKRILDNLSSGAVIPGILSLFNAGIGLIFGILIVRLLGPEDYGTYGLVASIFAITIIICFNNFSNPFISFITRITFKYKFFINNKM